MLCAVPPVRHVLLVEDHLVFRKAYAAVLAFGSSGDVILEAGSLAEARALFGKTTVDMAILDLTLPDGSGFELIPEIRAVHPHAGVAILTASTDPADLDQARVLGVRLLHKTAALAHLCCVIDHLSADGRMEWRRSRNYPDTRWKPAAAWQLSHRIWRSCGRLKSSALGLPSSTIALRPSRTRKRGAPPVWQSSGRAASAPDAWLVAALRYHRFGRLHGACVPPARVPPLSRARAPSCPLILDTQRYDSIDERHKICCRARQTHPSIGIQCGN